MPSKTFLDAEDFLNRWRRSDPVTVDEAAKLMDGLLEELAEYEVLAEPPLLDDVELAPDTYDNWLLENMEGDEDDEAFDEGQAQ